LHSKIKTKKSLSNLVRLVSSYLRSKIVNNFFLQLIFDKRFRILQNFDQRYIDTLLIKFDQLFFILILLLFTIKIKKVDQIWSSGCQVTSIKHCKQFFLQFISPSGTGM